jgi:hypothetical protein
VARLAEQENGKRTREPHADDLVSCLIAAHSRVNGWNCGRSLRRVRKIRKPNAFAVTHIEVRSPDQPLWRAALADNFPEWPRQIAQG